MNPTSSGLRWFQIAALAILAGHIALGAINATHISTSAIAETEMIVDGIISYEKLDGNLKAKIDYELPYTTSNRVPNSGDDTANTNTVTWEVGTAASRRAKWLYKPDGLTSADWEVYECVDPTTNAAVWTITTLSAEDLSDLAFKTQAQLEQDITIDISNTTGLQTALDGKLSLSGATQVVSGNVNFYGGNTEIQHLKVTSAAYVEGDLEVEGNFVLGSGVKWGSSIAYIGVETVISSTSAANKLASAKSVHDFVTTSDIDVTGAWDFQNGLKSGGLIDISETEGAGIKMVTGTMKFMYQLGSNITSGAQATGAVSGKALYEYVTQEIGAAKTQKEVVTVSTTGATEIVYTSAGTEFSVFAFRNGIYTELTHDPANSKYTFDALVAGENVTLIRQYFA